MYLFWNGSKLISFSFLFPALPVEQNLDQGKLAKVDVAEAKEASKQSTLALIKQIHDNLMKVSLQVAAFPEDQDQQFILAVSTCTFIHF